MKKNIFFGIVFISILVINCISFSNINLHKKNTNLISLQLSVAKAGEIEPMTGYESTCCNCPDGHHIKVCCPQGYADSCTKTCN